MNRRHFLRNMVVASLGLTWTARIRGGVQGSTSPVIPAGILDPAGETAYVANDRGGVDALASETGKLLWRSREAQRPLLVLGDRLYAHAFGNTNESYLVALNLLNGGECILESEAIVFPEWVRARDGHDHSFSAQWFLTPEHLALAWQARSWYGGPEKLGPACMEPFNREAAGRVWVHRISGQVIVLPGEVVPEQPLVLPPGLEKASLRWWGRLGGQLKVLVLQENPTSQKLVFRSWDAATGRATGDRELLQGTRLMVLPALDDRFLCLRDALPSPDETAVSKGSREKHGWHVVAVDTGDEIGRVPYRTGTQAFAVVNGRGYFLEAGPLRSRLDKPFVHPRKLHAVDLKTGKSLWEHPVEGKEFAPPPP
jgi:outer membrane protein assembly factor BamB